VIPGPTLARYKPWIAALGFTIGLGGMALERRWLVGLGVGVLGVAFLLRFADGGRETP
jgi:hypothetical protein